MNIGVGDIIFISKTIVAYVELFLENSYDFWYALNFIETI